MAEAVAQKTAVPVSKQEMRGMANQSRCDSSAERGCYESTACSDSRGPIYRLWRSELQAPVSYVLEMSRKRAREDVTHVQLDDESEDVGRIAIVVERRRWTSCEEAPF